MKLINNYKKDLIKSYNASILIELNKKDLDSFGEKDGLKKSIILSADIFNTHIKDGSSNLIYINADKYNKNDDSDKNPIVLLNAILDLTSEQVQLHKNIESIKSLGKSALSYFTGGLIKDTLSTYVDYGVDQITELLSDSTKNIFEYFSDELEIDLNEKIVDGLIDEIDSSTEKLIKFVDNLSKMKLHLSEEGKKRLYELSTKFNNDLTPVGIFTLIVELLLSIALNSRKVIFINNPHKLDNDSLAILSLLFSFAKNLKDKDANNKHLGISVVYCYSDIDFQPYQELRNDKYTTSKKLLEEQRRFTQRYAMLERPSSDIPNIAVKSSIFVGREKELKTLMSRFNISKKDKTNKNLELIVSDPGIGKTKLVEKHIKQIRENQEDGQKIIQLTLLNQVGHSSSNTGLSSLKDSIMKEANRLAIYKSMQSKIEDKAFEFVKDKVVDIIEDLLGFNNIVEIAKNINTAKNHKTEVNEIKENSSKDLNKKDKSLKEKEFENIREAILKLQNLSDELLPIILFIDDIQWIDDSSSEFILKYFTQTWAINPYIIATQRKSDATTYLKSALENPSLNEYKISFFHQSRIIEDVKYINPENITKLKVEIHHLSGLHHENLTELISLTIDAYTNHNIRSNELKEKDEILAGEIINYLSDGSDVITLFAIETINMLCDKKLYEREYDKENGKKEKIKEQLILQNPLRYNEKIIDFKSNLIKTFDLIKKSYEKAFEYLDWEKDDNGEKIQKFNLTAYSGLEERLYILREYFNLNESNNYGNAVVNTLLFSSLLGTPFNSEIVKNILKELSLTEKHFLQPLKNYIKESNQCNLEQIHYEIIEEVYEILSRYVQFDCTYSYKHNLLELFLDKQLEYILDSKLEKENIIEAKDKLFELVIKEIKLYEQKQSFYNKPILSLNNLELNYNYFYKYIENNVLSIALKNNIQRWSENYIDCSLKLVEITQSKNDFFMGLEILQNILNEENKLISYISTKQLIKIQNELGVTYRELGYLENSLKSFHEAENITLNSQETMDDDILLFHMLHVRYELSKNYYISEEYNKALTYADFVYEETINYAKSQNKESKNLDFNLVILHLDSLTIISNIALKLKFNDKAFEYAVKRKEILDQLIKNNRIDKNLYLFEKYITLNNLAGMYYDNNKLCEALRLQFRCYLFMKQNYNSNQQIWLESYVNTILNLSSYYHKNHYYTKSLKYCNKAIDIIENFPENVSFSINNKLLILYVKKIELYIKLYKDWNLIENIKNKLQNNETTSIQKIISMVNLSSIYSSDNKYKEAYEITKKSFELFTVNYGENSKYFDTEFGILYNLSYYTILLKKYNEAIKYLNQAINIFKSIIQYKNHSSLDNFIYLIYELIKIYEYNLNYNFIITLIIENISLIESFYGVDSMEYIDLRKKLFSVCENDINSKIQNSKELINAIKDKNSNIDLVKQIIDNSKNLNYQDSSGWTALHWAVRKENIEIVEYLLNKGVSIDIEASYSDDKEGYTGFTALYDTINRSKWEITDILLSNNANVDIPIKTGKKESPLINAIKDKNSNIDLVKQIIDNSKNLNYQDSSGWTALHWAVRKENIEIVEYLLNKGVSIDIEASYSDDKEGYTGFTALYDTINRSKWEITDILLSNNANVDIPIKTGKKESPLINAIKDKNSNIDLVKQIIDNSKNLNYQDSSGWTALHWAVRKENIEIVEYLLNK